MYEIYAAGAAAAFTVDCLVYPLDTIKTRYQSKDFARKYASSSASRRWLFQGLYQGIGSVIFATLPAAGIFFATYESMKPTISLAVPVAPQPLVHSAASALAEMASCVVLAPAEVIKQNAQMLRNHSGSTSGIDWASKHHSTSLEALRALRGTGTIRRLFTGYTALVARNLPFTALQFPIFEHVREIIWAKRRQGRKGGNGHGRYQQGLVETAVVTGVSAGSAGAFAACITTPSDVVKTRMMLHAGDSEQKKSPSSVTQAQRRAADVAGRKSGWVVALEIYRGNGLRGLFRGGLLRSSWTAIGAGLYLGTYEMSKLWLSSGKRDSDSNVIGGGL